LKKNPQIFEVWVERLATTDPQLALENLDFHIDTSDFFPGVAAIKRQREEPDIDPEIRARNIEIAHSQWVRDGNDPEAFVYEPYRITNKQLPS
jgi:hypothetical protein